MFSITKLTQQIHKIERALTYFTNIDLLFQVVAVIITEGETEENISFALRIIKDSFHYKH